MNVAAYYRHADLVVMTSKSEGIPVVLMEAMAHGKLVLAPDITGIPELVEHERTGFLYEPGSLDSFVSSVQLDSRQPGPFGGIRRAAAAKVAASYQSPAKCARLCGPVPGPHSRSRAETMRILYCNKYDYPFSGTESYLFDLIRRMDQRGHETALFSMDHGFAVGVRRAAAIAFRM